MKKPVSKFGLASLVSQPLPEAQSGSVDALLFAPSSSKATEEVPAVNTGRTRFTNTLPTATYVQLHQLAFWDRRDMSAIINEALQEYFARHPDASRPLPEPERAKRKLPIS